MAQAARIPAEVASHSQEALRSIIEHDSERIQNVESQVEECNRTIQVSLNLSVKTFKLLIGVAIGSGITSCLW